MAIAELTRGFDPALELSAPDADLDVRVDVHDASRIEWSVAVPLPERKPLQYAIEVEMEIPSNTFARHTPWDQMQSFTRLDGNVITSLGTDIVTIDQLRRGAVAIANRMARASEGFARHCIVAASLFTQVAPASELEQTLTVWLDGAIAMAEEARAKLVAPRPTDPVQLRRERELVDEYVSVRLLEMLAGAERGMSVLRESRSPRLEQFAQAVANVESCIADALEREMAHRADAGYVCPDPLFQEALERYLERASHLKKHFQEVLFLEPEVYQVAERLHHWVAAFVALLASTWAFAWQIALVNRRGPSAGSTVSSGIVVVAVVAGIIYATKDRLKELGRTWISGNVHRFYAQRVARYRAPARRLPGRDVIVTARESFDQRVQARPDPLNPDSGATVPTTLIRYVHKGSVLPQATLNESGVKRIKHVFRYDLSPLFARLDDPVKQIPVLDKVTHRVCFTAAPRSYRFPFRLRVTCEGKTWEEVARVVLHKGGLDRLDRTPEITGPISASHDAAQ
jgi:hypothetical protein